MISLNAELNILVIDVGTSGMKAVLMDSAGRACFRAKKTYRPQYPGNALVEQEPRDWADALFGLVSAAAAENRVDVIALTAQRSSVIALGKDGKVLRPALMWQDTRNASLCAELEKTHGERIRTLCGSPVNSVYSGGKMAWLKRQEPEIYRRAEKLLTVADYLVWLMTGCFRTDTTYASRSLLMDLRRRDWSGELLECFGLDREKLCDIRDAGCVIGSVSTEFAQQCGLRAGIPVVSCGGDQQCAALGQGASEPGVLSLNLGTGAYLACVTETVPERLEEGLVCNAFSIPSCYYLECSLPTCCAGLNWAMDLLFSAQDTAMISRALLGSQPGAGGVRFLPWFQGKTFPRFDPNAKALISGLSLSATREDILRALLEGIACEVAGGVDAMGGHTEIRTVRVSGGLSRCGEFCALLADVFGRGIEVSSSADATADGAWIAASAALGLFADCTEAWRSLREEMPREYHPRKENHELYRQIRALERDLPETEE